MSGLPMPGYLRSAGLSAERNLNRSAAPFCLRLVVLVGAILSTSILFAAERALDFRWDVLPILSDACFRCHGPDEPKREAKLRLDTKEGLFRTHEGVTVVRPGKPGDSALVQRITSRDPEKVMPPRNAIRQLTPEEISILQRWVSEGAPWAGHWAFAPIGQPVPPTVRGKDIRAIDAFVIARLEREKWTLSAEADRERLLRRVTLDLTGLPPTPAEAGRGSAAGIAALWGTYGD
jgi:hypothetical protein